MAKNKDATRLHYDYAITGHYAGQDNNFGCDSLASKAAGGPVAPKKGYLKDDERTARSPIDGNQANPDHGY
jgi:hypothetical protein